MVLAKVVAMKRRSKKKAKPRPGFFRTNKLGYAHQAPLFAEEVRMQTNKTTRLLNNPPAPSDRPEI
jgi:hypothetical protein